MVKVQISKSDKGYYRIESREHADNSIICAAVSGIMQGLAGTMLNVEPKPHIVEMTIGKGVVIVEIEPLDTTDQKIIDVVFLFAEVSLLQIGKKYPQNIELSTTYCG